jgi:hypothetical protein
MIQSYGPATTFRLQLQDNDAPRVNQLISRIVCRRTAVMSWLSIGILFSRSMGAVKVVSIATERGKVPAIDKLLGLMSM